MFGAYYSSLTDAQRLAVSIEDEGNLKTESGRPLSRPRRAIALRSVDRLRMSIFVRQLRMLCPLAGAESDECARWACAFQIGRAPPACGKGLARSGESAERTSVRPRDGR